ncbi:hypothetical protein VB734_08240 [Synechococcus sp. BA-124 BA4]|jgi:hypothetical protein|uniref:hypothetical protein n=1 Tax=unclassified Synechococcus TaxID=2626047 RepID=UPI002AD41CFF|nr:MULTISPECIES: hypothetical protein [unclassified Synechococcus]MEA5400025.1 hypothetical protein [Synechococcus sp. BA-124 BA4]CAK6701115.1 hypothetical protein BBFGKLBO_03022 [Synechococcus sp. CBW1107]
MYPLSSTDLETLSLMGISSDAPYLRSTENYKLQPKEFKLWIRCMEAGLKTWLDLGMEAERFRFGIWPSWHHQRAAVNLIAENSDFFSVPQKWAELAFRLELTPSLLDKKVADHNHKRNQQRQEWNYAMQIIASIPAKTIAEIDTTSFFAVIQSSIDRLKWGSGYDRADTCSWPEKRLSSEELAERAIELLFRKSAILLASCRPVDLLDPEVISDHANVLDELIPPLGRHPEIYIMFSIIKAKSGDYNFSKDIAGELSLKFDDHAHRLSEACADFSSKAIKLISKPISQKTDFSLLHAEWLGENQGRIKGIQAPEYSQDRPMRSYDAQAYLMILRKGEILAPTKEALPQNPFEVGLPHEWELLKSFRYPRYMEMSHNTFRVWIDSLSAYWRPIVQARCALGDSSRNKEAYLAKLSKVIEVDVCSNGFEISDAEVWESLDSKLQGQIHDQIEQGLAVGPIHAVCNIVRGAWIYPYAEEEE